MEDSQLANVSGGRPYDLEERTFEFAKRVRKFVKRLPRTVGNLEDVKQLVRSSGSIGANYIEANEALSKKDFAMRTKIARKEAKETFFWLRLIQEGNPALSFDSTKLIAEANELRKILSSILNK